MDEPLGRIEHALRYIDERPGAGVAGGRCRTVCVSDRLVVLGSCGAWPEPGRACSGFALEYGGARVVLDLGYGTLPRLLALLGSPRRAFGGEILIAEEGLEVQLRPVGPVGPAG